MRSLDVVFWGFGPVGSYFCDTSVLTTEPQRDLPLEVDANEIGSLDFEQRKEMVAWLAANIDSAPETLRTHLEELLTLLTAGSVSQTKFNKYARALAKALGLIPSSERRRHSGSPLAGLGQGRSRKPRNERERLEQERAHSNVLVDRYDTLGNKQREKVVKLEERLRRMAEDPQANQEQEIDFDTPVEEIELSEEAQAKSSLYAREVVERLELGDGADPALQSMNETLMNGSVVSTAEEYEALEVELPEGVREEDVVKALHETRVRYDFSVAVTRVELDVEKKVVVTEDGRRQVFSASTADFGPPRFAVTWQALATLAVLLGQFAMPLNRLATMLTTAAKQFTAGGLSRLAHYVAERLVPIYLTLADQLADSAILGGDDTSCRVVEVSSYLSQPKKKKERAAPPWAEYRTAKDAEKTYVAYMKRKEELLEQRAEGDRDAKRARVEEPPLRVVVGKELDFESARRDGQGPKQSLNVTVLTGRSVADDPESTLVFYRSHLGSLGNLLEMLLERRKASARELIVQSDLSTANLVTDSELTSRFKIDLVGCTSHARRPFALYEEQDPLYAPYMLNLFQGLALHEHLLERHGRNRENVLAVRGTDSRTLWELIKELAEKMVKKWSRETPLGGAARYILRHFEKLTAYLCDPRLDATNNLRERMLRTEKLIEKSSMFRRTIEGRVVLDILRTILQTAVAAGVPAHEYLVDVLKTDPDEVAKHPERFTPQAWLAGKTTAWLKRQAMERPDPDSAPAR